MFHRLQSNIHNCRCLKQAFTPSHTPHTSADKWCSKLKMLVADACSTQLTAAILLWTYSAWSCYGSITATCKNIGYAKATNHKPELWTDLVVRWIISYTSLRPYAQILFPLQPVYIYLLKLVHYCTRLEPCPLEPRSSSGYLSPILVTWYETVGWCVWCISTVWYPPFYCVFQQPWLIRDYTINRNI